jgi:hypothetical protein
MARTMEMRCSTEMGGNGDKSEGKGANEKNLFLV